jgi:G3E family GTPase
MTGKDLIGKDTIVTLKYTMKNGRGEILDNRRTTYLQGSSDISPTLQAQLQGLRAGDHRQIILNKGVEDADDDFTFDIVIESVRQAMQIHLLSGFLGSGKTTAIQQACRLLSKNGIPAAVISNDQGDKLVDGAFFDHQGIPGRQVTNGCFCCNYNDLDRCILSLTGHDRPAIDRPAILFAESVGSCTDLVATVLKPLLQQYPGWQPTVSVFADANQIPQILEDRTTFDPAVRYIYLKQLEEAQVIVVSKIDQAGNETDETPLRRLLAEHYPAKTILFQNSFNSDHIQHWLQTLEQLSPQSAALPSLNIDYDLYGAGEAQLAWLDQQLLIESPSHNAQSAALTLVTRLSQTNHPIGHLKCLLDGATKISFTSTSTTGQTPIHATRIPIHPSQTPIHPAARATLLINARIQTTPAILSDVIADAIQATEKTHNCTIRTLTASCFQPGFPRPTHRIP